MFDFMVVSGFAPERQMLSAPFKPSFGLSGIRVLDVPFRL
jgi:hypothetical protein